MYANISPNACGLACWNFDPENPEVLLAAQTGDLGIIHTEMNVCYCATAVMCNYCPSQHKADQKIECSDAELPRIYIFSDFMKYLL
jgi:hypothetical protein